MHVRAGHFEEKNKMTARFNFVFPLLSVFSVCLSISLQSLFISLIIFFYAMKFLKKKENEKRDDGVRWKA